MSTKNNNSEDDPNKDRIVSVLNITTFLRKNLLFKKISIQDTKCGFRKIKYKFIYICISDH